MTGQEWYDLFLTALKHKRRKWWFGVPYLRERSVKTAAKRAAGLD